MTIAGNSEMDDKKDIETLLKEIEKSLDIHFEKNELKHVQTFGELCDMVITKINLPDINDSKNQQAFYKLRNAISVVKGIDRKEIQPETKLADLFPRHGRKKIIRELQFEIGFNLKVLRPYLIIEAILIFMLFGSIIGLFFNLIHGLEILGLSIVLTNIAFTTGKEFNCETVGDLAKKITKDNARKAKGEIETMNPEEVVHHLELIFEGYFPESEEITRETRF